MEEKLVNVVNPEGRLVSVSEDELEGALNQGYRKATPQDEAEYKQRQEFESPIEQAKTLGEGLLSGVTFGASKAILPALGITDPSRTLAREEINPGMSLIGEAGSLFVPGIGPQKILTKAGQAVGKAVGLGAEAIGAKAVQTAVKAGATKEAAQLAKEAALKAIPTAQKIGSSAITAATENALFQAGHEFGRAATLFSAHPDVDPGEAAQTALTNIGLAAMLGGGIGAGIGAISPLWKSVYGKQTNSLLKALSDKLGGIDSAATSPMDEVAVRAGIELTPAAKAILSKDPYLQNAAKNLIDSPSKSGEAFKASLKEFRGKVQDSVLESIGKTADDLDSIDKFSAKNSGEELQEILSNKIKQIYEPIKNDYDQIASRYSTAKFNAGDRGVLEENLVNLSKEKGWSVRSSSPEAAFLNRAIKDIGEIDNLEKLRQFGDSLSKEAVGLNRFDIARDIGNLFDNAEDAFVKTRLGVEAPELLGKHAAVTENYKKLKDIINELNARLKVGSQKGVSSFLYKLNDMVPEQVLSRLAQNKDATFIEFLNKNFPEVQAAVKEYQINNILKSSLPGMGKEGVIDPTKLFKQFRKLSPELKASLLPEGGAERLTALEELWNSVHEIPRNFSGTASALERLGRYKFASAAGLLGFLTENNPLISAIIGHGAKILGSDVPDAVRWGMVKFLGSNQPIEAEGFKAMVDFIRNTIRGENQILRSTKAVFKAGQEVLPQAVIPDEKRRKKLDERLSSLRDNPEPMFNIGGKTSYYLPDNMSALAQTAVSVLNQLNGMRPVAEKKNPLDTEPVIPKSKKQEFDRALDIAEQPLVILQDLKEGTLTSQDVMLMQSMYPALYKRLTSQLYEQMIDSMEKGEHIPYRTRMGLSVFLGQPMDSTLTPEAIQATQSVQASSPSQGLSAPIPSAPKSLSSLKKLAPMNATRGQASEARRALK